MSKFAAIVSSDKPTRQAKKGGDEFIRVDLFHKNSHIASVYLVDVGQAVPEIRVRDWRKRHSAKL